MDFIWPNKNRELGSKLTYSCPFRTGTNVELLKRKKKIFFMLNLALKYQFLDQYVHCKWDKDTDNMVWWPPILDVCNREYKDTQNLVTNLLLIPIFSISLLGPNAKK